MNPLIQFEKSVAPFTIALVLACLVFPQRAQAVSPAPDGGYPGRNTAEGQNALLSLTSGTVNTAVGWYSLKSNTAGNFNTAIGAGTLFANTADQNTATGVAALFRNRIAIANTANGAFALFNNDSTGNGSGSWNSAFGASALFSNTDGVQNSAFGESALFANTTGNYNTALGDNALRLNQTGSGNTAVGYFALHQNTAANNTATGSGALTVDTTGGNNTAEGAGALPSNTTGNSNTAIGYQALFNTTTGSFNTALGVVAGDGVTTANNVICIGSVGHNVDNSCFINNIRDVITQNNDAIPVLIDSAGQLGTASSSRRYKTDIKPMDKASECVLALKPVTFRYKAHNDRTPLFGLIAEDVAAVNPDLVIYDADGKPYTVRYDAVNAMLLNEFLNERRVVQEQGATIARLEKQIDTLTAGLQKVSAQLAAASSTRSELEVSKSSLNNH